MISNLKPAARIIYLDFKSRYPNGNEFEVEHWEITRNLGIKYPPRPLAELVNNGFLEKTGIKKYRLVR